MGQNSYGSNLHTWMDWYDDSAVKPNTPCPYLHHCPKASYMAMDGFVIQNAYLSVTTAGIFTHGVESNEYGTATLHPVPDIQDCSDSQHRSLVSHGFRAGMNLLTGMMVNSFACVTRVSLKKTVCVFKKWHTSNQMALVYRQISFDSMHPGLSVRVMEDSNCMMVLDLLSVLTGNDRKKASQTLARVSSKPETSSLLTLRHPPPTLGKKSPRKLISFSNAIQLLLVLPKRTVDLQTRRSVAGILADYFEAVLDHPKPTPVASQCSPETAQDAPSAMLLLTLKHTQLQIQQQAIDMEYRRKHQPLEDIRQCLDLLQKIGPLSEEEAQGFRCAIAGHMTFT